jgi:hypothetical protein
MRTILAVLAMFAASLAYGAEIGDIVALAKSGVGDEVIKAFIETQPGKYKFSVETVKELKAAGCSDDVIVAVMKKSGGADAEVGAKEAEPRGEATTFYEELSPHGRWIKDNEHGLVWQPTIIVVEKEWRPYCDGGRWVWTDCGWYWQSSYSWGWAAFHYGRWHRHVAHGWVWVPGRVWGPAWVHWRECDDHYGWAPLPPSARYEVGVGFRFSGRNVDVGFHFGLVEDDYAFVPCRSFLEINLVHLCAPRHHVRNIYNRTTIVNNTYVYQNNTVINNGIPTDSVARRTEKKIVAAKIADVKNSRRAEKHEAERISAYRPKISEKAPGAAAKSQEHSLMEQRRTIDRQRGIEQGKRRQEDAKKKIEQRRSEAGERNQKALEEQRKRKELRERRSK